jgi:hypothetical protein
MKKAASKSPLKEPLLRLPGQSIDEQINHITDRRSGLAITYASNEDKSFDSKETGFTFEGYIANRSFFCRARGALSFLRS